MTCTLTTSVSSSFISAISSGTTPLSTSERQFESAWTQRTVHLLYNFPCLLYSCHVQGLQNIWRCVNFHVLLNYASTSEEMCRLHPQTSNLWIQLIICTSLTPHATPAPPTPEIEWWFCGGLYPPLCITKHKTQMSTCTYT